MSEGEASLKKIQSLDMDREERINNREGSPMIDGLRGEARAPPVLQLRPQGPPRPYGPPPQILRRPPQPGQPGMNFPMQQFPPRPRILPPGNQGFPRPMTNPPRFPNPRPPQEFFNNPALRPQQQQPIVLNPQFVQRVNLAQVAPGPNKNSDDEDVPAKAKIEPIVDEPKKEVPIKRVQIDPEIENGERNPMVQSNNAASVRTTNGIKEETDKRSSTAESPIKSPSKSARSLPKTPDIPTSASTERKKIPMNKVQVGATPSPNLKTVRSKIGSLENASYKPGGGKVKIENRKVDFSKAQPKIAAKNDKYMPSGGDKKIQQVKLQWNAKPKIGSLDNATYKPGGGDKKIETVKLDFKDKAKPKVGSKDNAKHTPGGGIVKIHSQKMDVKAESKIGSLDNVKHKPGGGDKKIFNDKEYLQYVSSNVESLCGSGTQSPVPTGSIDDGKNHLPTSDENLNQGC